MRRARAGALAAALLLGGCAQIPTIAGKPRAAAASPPAVAAPAPQAPEPAPPRAAKPSERSIHFERDSLRIDAQYRATLEAHARYAMHAEAVRIEGHADERGSREYQLALGQRRAGAVKGMLTLLGVPADRIETLSYGGEKPRLACAEESCRRDNRRVDIAYP